MRIVFEHFYGKIALYKLSPQIFAYVKLFEVQIVIVAINIGTIVPEQTVDAHRFHCIVKYIFYCQVISLRPRFGAKMFWRCR